MSATLPPVPLYAFIASTGAHNCYRELRSNCAGRLRLNCPLLRPQITITPRVPTYRHKTDTVKFRLVILQYAANKCVSVCFP
jgi:hypothetical protein